MSTIHKIGIIGAGAIVELAHLPVLKTLKNVDVKWICDINVDNCVLLSSMYDVKVIDINLLDSALKDIDICLLTIPYGARPTYIEKISNNNCALYIEKPFAIDSEEHLSIMKRFSPNKLAVGYQRRYFQIVDELKHIIEDNIYGSLKKISLFEGNFHIKGNKSYLSNYKMAGGGIIIESAIHALDQILLILEAENVLVENVRSLAKNKIDYDSTIKGQIQGKNNAIAYELFISNLRNFNNGLYMEFENCTLKCDLSVESTIAIKSKNSNRWYTIAPVGDRSNYPSSINESFKYIWEDFIAALDSGQSNRSSASGSILTTSWIEQIYRNV